MEDSIFTKIVKGEIPAQKIYEDDLTLAFLDIHPVSKGHTLVIPKQQIDHLDDCPPELYAAIFATVQKVSKLLKAKLQPVRVSLAVNGFDVPHAHVHLIPRYANDGIAFPQAAEGEPDFEALTQLAASLRD